MPDVKRNKKLILERVEKEATLGMDYVDEKIGERFRGLIGRALRKIAKEIFEWARRRGAVKQGVKVFEYVLDTAIKNPGEDVKKLADKHLDGYLKKHILYQRIEQNHPKVEELKRAFKKEFEARLRIYKPIVLSEGSTYEELVKKAYPRRKELEKLIDEQFKTTRRTLEIIEKNPEMLRVPGAIKKPLLKLAFASMDFMHEKIINDLDHIYGEKK